MALGDAWGHDALTYSGKEMRELVEGLTGGFAGVVGPSTALTVTQQAAPATTVKVAEGGFVIPATGAGLGGSYQGWNDADLNSPAFTATGVDGRKDRLIVRVTAGVPALEIVQGTASGSPAEPAITGDNYLELALITLPGVTTNITTAMITNRQVRFAAGVPVICTSTTRPASPWAGLPIFETNTGFLLTWDGAAWVQGLALGAWPTYTPTLTQSAAVAKTVTRAAWTRQGRMISGDFDLAVTATGAANNAITVHLPVPAAAGYSDGAIIGSGYWFDTSAPITLHGNLGIVSDDRVSFYAGSAANAGNQMGLTSSPNGAAIASGDRLVGSFRYEAAS